MESIKEQVVDNVPKRIKELKFGIPFVHSERKQKSPSLADILTDQARTYSIRQSWRYVTEIFMILPEIEHPLSMDLLTLVWGPRARPVYVKPVVKL